jgi:plastocyanin
MFFIIATGIIAGCSCNHRNNSTISGSVSGINGKMPENGSGAIKKSLQNVDTIVISDMRFQPSEINVQRGDTIIWINHDLVSHCVTETGKEWSSSIIPAGGSWKLAVTKNSDYFCAIHPVMKGRIVVK